MTITIDNIYIACYDVKLNCSLTNKGWLLKGSLAVPKQYSGTETEMNKEVFRGLILQRLNMSVNEFGTSVRLSNALNNTNTTTVIQIYQNQESWGGYGKSCKKIKKGWGTTLEMKRAGWLGVRNLGRKSLAELERVLESNGFPGLKDAPAVIEEYERLTASLQEVTMVAPAISFPGLRAVL